MGGGSPTFTNSGKGYHYWSMDSASTESVAATRFLPDSWSAFDVELWWVNDSSGSGDAAWRLSWMFAGDGESTGASGTLTPESIVTDTAGGEDGMVVVSIASGLTATSGKMLLVRVGREGGNVGDTLGNDAGVVHVRLKKAS